MFFGNKMTDVIASEIANSVYSMRDFMRNMPCDEAIAIWSKVDPETGKPIRGEVTVIDDETFTVMFGPMAMLGTSFTCKTVPGDDNVTAAMCQLPAPYQNITIKFNTRTMKYFLACPKSRLNRKEKRMCQFLSEERDIDLGYEYRDDPDELPPIPASVHLPAAQQFCLAIVAMVDGEIDLREQEVLLNYFSRVAVEGKSPEDMKDSIQQMFDFIEEHGCHSSVDFVKQKFIGDPKKVPKIHAELLIQLCIELMLVDGTCTVDECEIILGIGVHALGLGGGSDVGRLLNVTALERELAGHNMSQMHEAMSELVQRLKG